jgi:hypothetical protein
MRFFYGSGEEVRAGDRVTYFSEPGQIEFVADDDSQAPEGWDLEAGVMIIEPKVFGCVFVQDPADEEDLVFIARGYEDD